MTSSCRKTKKQTNPNKSPSKKNTINLNHIGRNKTPFVQIPVAKLFHLVGDI
jgi:hypothetical protein